MLVGDLNTEESKPYLSQFLYEYNAKNIDQGKHLFYKCIEA